MRHCPVCKSIHIGASITNEWVRCFDCGYTVSRSEHLRQDIEKEKLKHDLKITRQIFALIEEIESLIALAKFKRNSSYFMKKEGLWPIVQNKA